MARPPYHIARQEHVGDALDDLARRGLLSWRWEYIGRRAVYCITERSRVEKRYDTRSAELLIEREYAALGVPWLPVPHPGGEEQRGAALRRIATLRGQRNGEHTSNANDTTR